MMPIDIGVSISFTEISQTRVNSVLPSTDGLLIDRLEGLMEKSSSIPQKDRDGIDQNQSSFNAVGPFTRLFIIDADERDIEEISSIPCYSHDL
jgi:hypothetical protein